MDKCNHGQTALFIIFVNIPFLALVKSLVDSHRLSFSHEKRMIHFALGPTAFPIGPVYGDLSKLFCSDLYHSDLVHLLEPLEDNEDSGNKIKHVWGDAEIMGVKRKWDSWHKHTLFAIYILPL